MRTLLLLASGGMLLGGTWLYFETPGSFSDEYVVAESPARLEHGPGWEALSRGALEEAEGIWHRDLVQSRSEDDELGIGLALARLSHIAEARGDQRTAIDQMERALEYLGVRDSSYSVYVQRLAALYSDSGLDREAERVLLDLAEQMETGAAADRSRKATVLYQLAVHYADVGQEVEAERTFLKGIELLGSASGPQISLDLYLRALVTLYERQNRFHEAAQACDERIPLVRELFPKREEVTATENECARLRERSERMRRSPR